MAGDYRMKIRIEIVREPDGVAGAPDLGAVEEEVLRMVPAGTAASIDDMEEVVIDNAYEAMRGALAKHFAEVSKKGLSNTRGRKDG